MELPTQLHYCTCQHTSFITLSTYVFFYCTRAEWCNARGRWFMVYTPKRHINSVRKNIFCFNKGVCACVYEIEKMFNTFSPSKQSTQRTLWHSGSQSNMCPISRLHPKSFNSHKRKDHAWRSESINTALISIVLVKGQASRYLRDEKIGRASCRERV